MELYIPKSALVAEIENLENTYKKCPTRNSYEEGLKEGRLIGYRDALHKIDTLEVKEVDLIIHTIIAECCDWLAMNTELNHYEIEDCRNLMLAVKDEQLKTQKGEEV